jgi:glutamine synthetase
MLDAIGGIRTSMAESMLVLAPNANSWRRFASAVYSPASNSWGVEDRNVALRIPAGGAKTRHFEHRIAGVDANPYLVAAITLGAALDGIEAGGGAGASGREAGAAYALPRHWLDAIDAFERSEAMERLLGPVMHQGYAAIKRAEYLQVATEVTDAEWRLYGFVV